MPKSFSRTDIVFVGCWFCGFLVKGLLVISKIGFRLQEWEALLLLTSCLVRDNAVMSDFGPKIKVCGIMRDSLYVCTQTVKITHWFLLCRILY